MFCLLEENLVCLHASSGIELFQIESGIGKNYIVEEEEEEANPKRLKTVKR